MFRNTKPTKLVPENFSVGSTITGAPGEKYLVVGFDKNRIGLIDLQTFMTVGYPVTVEDDKFLSLEEVLQLLDFTDRTFADFTLDAKGLK